MTKSTDIASWLNDIAAKAKVDRPTVETILAKHSVRPIIKPAIPQRLHVKSLAFSGRKKGKLDSAISFDWDDLNPGVYAIVSNDNFMGKTTIVKLMKYALSGSAGPQADIDGWFHTLTLRFAVDDDVYETRIEDFSSRSGSLVSIKAGKEKTLHRFEGEETFRRVMEAFFFDRLGLHTTKIIVNNGGKEVVQEHGWPWLSSVMSIDPDPKDVFGSFPAGIGGMPSYLMRMFVGLPWVGTHTDIKAALKSIGMEGTRVDQAAARNQAAARARLGELERERAEVAKKLTGPSEFDVFDAQEKKLLQQILVLSGEVSSLALKRTELLQNVSDAEKASNNAIRERFAFDEAQQAGTVFRLLRPEYCPSCDEVFTDEYRQEKESHHDCVVCGRHEKGNDDVTGVREALVEREVEAKDRLKKLVSASKSLEAKLDEKNKDKLGTEVELKDVQIRIRSSQTSTGLWRDAVRLDAQIEEVRRALVVEPEKDDLSQKVLDAADKVTKKLFEEDQASILNDVAELTTQFAQSFGLKTLERVEFSGVNMRVFKSGSTMPFGSCTPGEKTRLKIAANLSMIQVAEKRGLGRHPGLLFIDSPGANEAVDKDVANIVEGLAKLPEILPDVQVFLTCIANERILSHVPCNNLKEPRDDGYMW